MCAAVAFHVCFLCASPFRISYWLFLFITYSRCQSERLTAQLQRRFAGTLLPRTRVTQKTTALCLNACVCVCVDIGGPVLNAVPIILTNAVYSRGRLFCFFSSLSTSAAKMLSTLLYTRRGECSPARCMFAINSVLVGVNAAHFSSSRCAAPLERFPFFLFVCFSPRRFCAQYLIQARPSSHLLLLFFFGGKRVHCAVTSLSSVSPHRLRTAPIPPPPASHVELRVANPRSSPRSNLQYGMIKRPDAAVPTPRRCLFGVTVSARTCVLHCV